MTNFVDPDSHIHNIARGLLIQGDEVILCHTHDDDEWYFLPGGHIEDGEAARKALQRELQEEFTDIHATVTDFVGVCESVFSVDSGKQHEINMVFAVEVDDASTLTTTEDHIDFTAVSKNELSERNILPEPLKRGIISWLDTGETFFKNIAAEN